MSKMLKNNNNILIHTMNMELILEYIKNSYRRKNRILPIKKYIDDNNGYLSNEYKKTNKHMNSVLSL